MHSPPNKTAIVGAGAVGLFYGARLAAKNSEVHFLLRSDYQTVKSRGIEISSPAGDFVLPAVNAHQSAEDIGACDLVVIAVKATANEVLPKLLPPLLKDGTMLLTLQNGLGNEEFLASHFGDERVLGGKCFVCLNRVAPGVVKHIGHGVVSLGEFRRAPQARTRGIAQMFRDDGVACEVCENIEEVLWRKLTWNIPFNGLPIAFDKNDVGQVLADEKLLEETRSLMRETIAIAGASGVLIEESYIEFQIERTRKMGAYKPSSLLDFEGGREVEIESIWGAPFRRAQERNIAVPHLENLLNRCALKRLNVFLTFS